MVGISFCTDNLLCFVVPSWLLWIAAGLVLNAIVQWKHLLPSIVSGVMEYGKLRLGESKSGLGYLLTVPKRWFTHFYIWGVIWNYFLFSVFTLKCIFHSNIPIPITIDTLTGGLLHRECTEVSQYHFNVFVVLLLLCVQVSRRLYECLYVSVFSSSRMHIVHYVLGLYFYTAVGPTALLHLNSASLDYSRHATLKHPSPVLVVQQFARWYHILATVLFLWASYHQHRCHKILAGLRKPTEKKQASLSSCSPNGSNNGTLSNQNQQFPDGADKKTKANIKFTKLMEKKSVSSHALKALQGDVLDEKQQLLSSGSAIKTTTPKYGLPTGDWFYYVSCPHLFAEILIYISLLACQVWSEVACSWWLVVAHVTCSLFLSARQMHSWYRNKFEDYPKNRTSLFPGVC